MSTTIALTSSADPVGQSSSGIVTSTGAEQSRACLEMHEAEKATGGAKPGGLIDTIKFQFNPKEVTISKSAQWEKKPAKGAKKAGPPEYKGADPCKLTLEMFFDSTLQSDDTVVESVEKLFSCCVPIDKNRANKPMPPLVVFKWGGITSFPAYVTQVQAKYTRFASNGVPIRAVCTVNLEEMPSEAGQQNPTSGVLAPERSHTMIAGDTLALVAYNEYGDPVLWRPLAAYNRIDDPMRIARGAQILLPAVEVLAP
jgi:Contractile injection system tube protein